ncbi:hypothetical protein [Occultella gossypii]|uniref:Lipoprotein n=1 Tax=Occultella gossypii TaxID=2800820 RepID=A0ABS7S9M1_9MICO|nr:hypothetical protein [Occultella gossypii]MBZ2196812.1 hypothetical protein [Occultella gossypii]
MVGLVLALALTGCAGPGGSAGSAAPEESTPGSPEAPWGDDHTPTAIIEFEQGGEHHTVSGEIPAGLMSCADNGVIAIGSSAPDPAIGVMFTYEPGTSIASSVWIVGDEYAAQVLADGVVTSAPAEDGGTTYSAVGATGRASVLPRDADLTEIGDYEFGPDDQVEATASFTVTCPPG